MSRWIRGGLGLFALTVGALVAVLVWGGPELRSFPDMPSSYEAKEYCSCRWTSGMDATFCDDFVFQTIIPTQGRTIDEAGKSVTARALFRSNTARWVDDRQGCVLVR